VNYQEKTYAAGKIPGGYFKREGRPTEKETLTSRLIDRPIRPLFADGYKNDTQVICTVLSTTWKTTPTWWHGRGFRCPDAVRRAVHGPDRRRPRRLHQRRIRPQPAVDEMPESELDLVVAGTNDAVLMVESEAKELPEDVMLGAVMFGQKASSR
jgi:polyribonucleotide nucleotidyltransferase